MTFKVRKPVSKLLGIGTFLLLLILKGASPKAALALVDDTTVGSYIRQHPEQAGLFSSELAPAVATPTPEGISATITSTTPSGATTTFVKAAARVAVVTAGVLTPESTANDANIAWWYYWNQATNQYGSVKR